MGGQLPLRCGDVDVVPLPHGGSPLEVLRVSPHRYRPSPGGVSPVKRVGGMGIDYVEVVLLLLPAITIVMIGVNYNPRQ